MPLHVGGRVVSTARRLEPATSEELLADDVARLRSSMTKARDLVEAMTAAAETAKPVTVATGLAYLQLFLTDALETDR